MSFLFFESLSCHLPILCSCILLLFPATHYFGLKLLPSFLRYPSHLYCHSSLIVWSGESESHSVVSDSLRPHGLYSPWNSPGQNTGVGSLSLLQGIFPTQGLNPSLLHCRWILYQLSHKECVWSGKFYGYFDKTSNWWTGAKVSLQSKTSYSQFPMKSDFLTIFCHIKHIVEKICKVKGNEKVLPYIKECVRMETWVFRGRDRCW